MGYYERLMAITPIGIENKKEDIIGGNNMLNIVDKVLMARAIDSHLEKIVRERGLFNEPGEQDLLNEEIAQYELLKQTVLES